MNLLKQITALEVEAAEFGFQWEKPLQIMEQIQSECEEVAEHLNDAACNRQDLQEEIGDLLHAVLSLCVFCQFNPEETLALTLKKFEKRLKAVKAIAKEQHLTNLKSQSFKELMMIWEEAKGRVG